MYYNVYLFEMIIVKLYSCIIKKYFLYISSTWYTVTKKVPLCLLSLDKTRKNQQAFTTIYLVYRTISPSLHFVFLKFYASMNKCREEKYK